MKIRGLFRHVAVGSTALWLAVFALIPFLLVLGASFLSRSESHFLLPSLSLEGYRVIFSRSFLMIFLDSVVLSGTTTLFCLLIGYPFAYLLARIPTRKKNLLLFLVIIPFWTNSLIRIYAVVFILRAGGLLNTVLMGCGIIEDPLMLLYTDTAVLVGLIYTLIPFMILPLYASIEKLDPRLMEASRDLEAGRLRTFVHISLPLTLPGIIAGTLLVFLPALGMFYIPGLLGGAKSMLVGNFIKNQFLTARNWPVGSAASVALTALMALLLVVYHYTSAGFSRERATTP